MVSLRFGLGAMILIGALFFALSFHYFVWGKWLGGMLRAEQQSEEEHSE